MKIYIDTYDCQVRIVKKHGRIVEFTWYGPKFFDNKRERYYVDWANDYFNILGEK